MDQAKPRLRFARRRLEKTANALKQLRVAEQHQLPRHEYMGAPFLKLRKLKERRG